MKRYLFIFLSIILISGLIFTSCSSSTTPATTSKTAPEATTKAPVATTQTSSGPQSGGNLKILTEPGVTNLGAPGQPGGSNDGPYRQPALEELLTFDPGKLGIVKPFLATAWQWSPDYTYLTLTLRKGVKFHDGTDFNADAAKFSLDLVRASGSKADLTNVTSIDVVDDYTIRLNTKVYDSGLLNSLAYCNTPMISPKAYNAMGKDVALFHPVGTGPFKFVNYTRDVSLKYERFADYWQKPKPYLDSLEFVFVADPTVMLASFKAGEAQIIRNVPVADAADLKAKGYTVNTLIMTQLSMIGDSLHTDSVYNNLKVRQALSYSYDSAVLAKSIGMGFFLPANQLISPVDAAYNTKIVGYPYNPEKAKKLLSEAGYPNGFDTQITYRNTSYQTDLFTLMQSYFKAIGVNLKLKLTDQAGNNDLRQNGWTGLISYSFPPAVSGFEVSYWFKDRLSSEGAMYKCSALIPADYDAKVLSLASITDPVAKQAAIDEAGKMAIDTYCLVFPMLMEASISAYTNAVHDCDFFSVYSMNYHSENFWLSK